MTCRRFFVCIWNGNGAYCVYNLVLTWRLCVLVCQSDGWLYFVYIICIMKIYIGSKLLEKPSSYHIHIKNERLQVHPDVGRSVNKRRPFIHLPDGSFLFSVIPRALTDATSCSLNSGATINYPRARAHMGVQRANPLPWWICFCNCRRLALRWNKVNIY